MHRSIRVCLRTCVFAAVLVGMAFAQQGVEYRDRGNRSEGVRSLPVSGFTIELLSFRVIYKELPPVLDKATPFYRMRFFLERPASAYVVVREVDNRHSYWLDKVNPPVPWRPGFDNMFEWPTAEVIKQLPGLGLDDLGVTVRVGSEHPSDLERVAPVILYTSAPPLTVGSYEFAFKTNVTAGLEFSIKRSDGSPMSHRPEPSVLNRWSYGVPLRVTLNMAASPAGEYLFKVEGRVLENNQKFGKEIRFFHQPTVR